MKTEFLSFMNLIAQAGGEEAEEGEEMLGAVLEFSSLILALIAFYFAIRILPSIGRDVRKRSWLFLSLAAISFGIAMLLSVMNDLGIAHVEAIYETTEFIFILLFAIGFYYMFTSEHRETLKLRRQSTTDDLTSLYTHGFFQTYLVNKVSNLKSDGTNLTVLFLDIDDFKQYNDQFGHQEGDYVLQKVAQTITQEARGEDIASRYGGEEFTLILGCDYNTACRVAERLRSSIEERCSTFADPNVKRSVTVSIGLSSFGIDAEAGDKLVKIADARMYEAKRRGKNQVYTGDVDLEEAEARQQGHGKPNLGIVPG
ncbi:MAG: GGDEF domain-containing protein [Thermoleophilia bacterium]|nr:GGDEF domain-containing protein [Thermoleophilia bacterium]